MAFEQEMTLEQRMQLKQLGADVKNVSCTAILSSSLWSENPPRQMPVCGTPTEGTEQD